MTDVDFHDPGGSTVSPDTLPLEPTIDPFQRGRFQDWQDTLNAMLRIKRGKNRLDKAF